MRHACCVSRAATPCQGDAGCLRPQQTYCIAFSSYRMNVSPQQISNHVVWADPYFPCFLSSLLSIDPRDNLP